MEGLLELSAFGGDATGSAVGEAGTATAPLSGLGGTAIGGAAARAGTATLTVLGLPGVVGEAGSGTLTVSGFGGAATVLPYPVAVLALSGLGGEASVPPPDLSQAYYAIYRVSDGEVTRGGEMPRYYLQHYPTAQLPVGHAIMEVPRRPDLGVGEWVSGGVMTAGTAWAPTVSKTTIAADGVDSSVISGLPNPSSVTVTHERVAEVSQITPNQTETGGTLTITSTIKGTIKVVVISPGKTRWEGTIIAG